MEEHIKEVRFDLYCKDCKHEDSPENTGPCWYCLAMPMNTDSHKPLLFKEKDGNK